MQARFLNIWKWAQLGSMLVMVLCFGLISYFGFTYIVDYQAKAMVEKDFLAIRTSMQANGEKLIQSADNVARIIESGDATAISRIEDVAKAELVSSDRQKLDLIFVMNKQGKYLYCENKYPASEDELQLGIIKEARKGEKVFGIERISEGILMNEGLLQRAQMLSRDGSGKVINDGLMRLAGVPFYVSGKQAGIVIVGMLISNSPTLVDLFASKYNGQMSIFLDGYRISTSIKDKNENRILGTKMPNEAYESLYVKGKPYLGKVKFEQPSLAKYNFLYNIEGKPIAVMGIAEDFNMFTSLFQTITIYFLLIAILLGLLWLYNLRTMCNVVTVPIRLVSEGAMHLAHNNLSYRVPTINTIKCWEMRHCDNIECPMHGTDGESCWLVENTMCTGKVETLEEKTEICKRCQVYLSYSRNEALQLVATFNFMANEIEKQTMESQKKQLELQNLVKELEDYESVILTLANAVEAKDTYTLGHSERVSSYALALGKKLHLSEGELETLRIGTLLHDIGKIGVRDEILRKPSALTNEEFAVVKEHPVQGATICASLNFASRSRPVIYYHHERYDGKGYPEGIKGESIPFLVRITTIADAFDAMTSDRPYRSGINLHQAMEELLSNAGKQFDPLLVEVFIDMLSGDEIKILKSGKRGA